MPRDIWPPIPTGPAPAADPAEAVGPGDGPGRDAYVGETARRLARHTPTRHAELEALPLAEVTLRVGNCIPRHLYVVTREHPEGIDVGAVATAEIAAEIVRRWNAAAEVPGAE